MLSQFCQFYDDTNYLIFLMNKNIYGSIILDKCKKNIYI